MGIPRAWDSESSLVSLPWSGTPVPLKEAEEQC